MQHCGNNLVLGVTEVKLKQVWLYQASTLLESIPQ